MEGLLPIFNDCFVIITKQLKKLQNPLGDSYFAFLDSNFDVVLIIMTHSEFIIKKPGMTIASPLSDIKEESRPCSNVIYASKFTLKC